VGVGRAASAANILFVTSRVHDNGIIWGSCVLSVNTFCLIHSSRWHRSDCSHNVPTRLASSGLMSKISMPCIFPKISRRSRPVACSRSVGTVPGFAPGGRRSASVLISVIVVSSAIDHTYVHSTTADTKLGKAAIGGQAADAPSIFLNPSTTLGGLVGWLASLLTSPTRDVSSASYDSSPWTHGGQRW
jgi:hypothetical protein